MQGSVSLKLAVFHKMTEIELEKDMALFTYFLMRKEEGRRILEQDL